MSAGSFSFKRPSRSVHSVFLHCSASDNAAHDNVKTMQSWHVKRGFSEIGYHFFISKNGDIHEGRSIEKVPAAQKGHNTGSIAICLHGLDVAKFTEAQFSSLKSLCSQIESSYGEKKIVFRGHCEVSAKTCPVFDYKKVLSLDENGKITKTSGTISSYLSSQFIFNGILELFAKGQKVQELQTFLNDAGFPTKKDGVFGQATQQSVEAYQKSVGLKADGIVGPKTLEAMGTLKKGCKGNAVKLLQKQLTVKGYKLLADGKFGLGTEKQVKAFQLSNKLKNDGIAGKKTKEKLFGRSAGQLI
ncbi:peptidoglycan recognition protein family protein [Agarivorans albus]|uniref:N-acetylmuramoyl-L-alanine amidase n=1 Tax=Agarivorans albus MKT 106 TaxID=1331007 RepID=R9PFJ8_AGAAL|nr:N-acetylmuramoyl-L-alanine amidase [Agarivorans albus]GAD00159.1 hypothetical protein AALB_0239 [Agarivorans albus MKT 106]